MNVAALLTKCRAAGVTVRLDGDLLRLRGAPDAVAAAKIRLKPHKAEIIRHMLGQFRIDQSAADPEPELIDRINDMAWQLMEVDGLSFDAAIGLAADITVHCQVAACERSYISVRELWIRLTL